MNKNPCSVRTSDCLVLVVLEQARDSSLLILPDESAKKGNAIAHEKKIVDRCMWRWASVHICRWAEFSRSYPVRFHIPESAKRDDQYSMDWILRPVACPHCRCASCRNLLRNDELRW